MSWVKVISPQRFDENEIYGICIAVLVVCIIVFLQKKYKCLYTTELLFIWAFDHMFSVFGDYLLALKPLDLYDTFDEADADLGDILLHVIDYPGVVIIFVCIYALTRPKGIKRMGVILAGAVTGAVIEFIGVEFFHLYLYKRWSTFYSFIFYIFIFSINLFIYDKAHQYILRKRQRPLYYK